MKLFTIIYYFFAAFVSAITCLEIETENYSTKIIFEASEENPLKGVISSETTPYGICEGKFFLDLEGSRLKLTYSSQKCRPQNMSLLIDANSLFYIAHNRSARVVYYEQEVSPYDPRQALIKTCVNSL